MLNSPTAVRDLVIAEIQRLLAEVNRPCPAEITEEAALTDDIGLDSLSLASLYIALEDALQVDPFSNGINVTDMRTVGDVVNAYGAMIFAPA